MAGRRPAPEDPPDPRDGVESVDVTEPDTPEEVVMTTLDQLLAEYDEVDTAVYADNVVIALRAAGFMQPAEGDSR